DSPSSAQWRRTPSMEAKPCRAIGAGPPPKGRDGSSRLRPHPSLRMTRMRLQGARQRTRAREGDPPTRDLPTVRALQGSMRPFDVDVIEDRAATTLRLRGPFRVEDARAL